jgi:hypothetical protein
VRLLSLRHYSDLICRNKILADLHAKLAEKDTLIAHLWDEVAQIDEASQAACKTYAHEMGKVVGAMDDARETTIAAIDEIIAGEFWRWRSRSPCST